MKCEVNVGTKKTREVYCSTRVENILWNSTSREGYILPLVFTTVLGNGSGGYKVSEEGGCEAGC